MEGVLSFKLSMYRLVKELTAMAKLLSRQVDVNEMPGILLLSSFSKMDSNWSTLDRTLCLINDRFSAG
jgi:hypothetical protein